MPQPLLILDAAGELLDSNPAADALLAAPGENLLALRQALAESDVAHASTPLVLPVALQCDGMMRTYCCRATPCDPTNDGAAPLLVQLTELPITIEAMAESPPLGGELATQAAHAAEISRLNAALQAELVEKQQMQQKLAASEERLRLATQVGAIGIWDLENGSGELILDPQMRTIHGFDAETPITFPQWLAKIAAEDRAAFLQASRMAVASGESQSVEYRVIGADGSVRHVLSVGGVVKDEQGAIARQIGVSVDITERNRLEEALRQREDRLRLVLENSPDVIWIWDQAGNLLFVSQAMQALYAVSPEAILSAAARAHARAAEIPAAELSAQRLAELGALDVTFAENWLRAQAAVQQCVESPGAQVQQEAQVRMPDGKVHGVHSRFQSFRRSAGAVEVVEVTHDISELMQARDQVQRTLRQLKLATDAAELGIWKWNFADDSLEWDDRVYEFYGVPPGTQGLVREHWRAHIHPDDLALNDATLVNVRHTTHDRQSTFRILLPDGSVRYIYSSAVAERDASGAPIGMIGVNRDITDQKIYEQYLQNANSVLEQRVAERTEELRESVEELRRANAGKDAFLAAVSHELRTPLAGILSIAESLAAELRGPLNDYQQRYVAAIRLSGDRLLDMVNSVLNYTYAMAADAAPLQVCRLAELCAVAVQHARRKADAKQQRIDMDINPIDLTVMSNGESIEQILNALLDNAVKFTPQAGHLGVEIGVTEDGGAVQITVWDTGIGIGAEQMAYLFKPLTQVDQRLAREYEGIGLGLAFVKRRVALLGGTVTVESEAGQGSRFVVRLPINLQRS